MKIALNSSPDHLCSKQSGYDTENAIYLNFD